MKHILIILTIIIILYTIYNLINMKFCYKNKIIENFDTKSETLLDEIQDQKLNLKQLLIIPEDDVLKIDNIYIGLFENIEKNEFTSIYRTNDFKSNKWIINDNNVDNNNISFISLNHKGELICFKDNKMMIKRKTDYQDNMNTEANFNSYLDVPWTEWTEWKIEQNVRYIMFLNRVVVDKVVKLLYLYIDLDGNLNIIDIESDETTGKTINVLIKDIDLDDNVNIKLDKIFRNVDGGFLGLFEDNKLRKSDKLESEIFSDELMSSENSLSISNLFEIEFNKLYNETQLVDVIYDNDKKLLGIGKINYHDENNNEIEINELLKQNNKFYLSDFKKLNELYKLNQLDSKNILSVNKIIYYKNGFLYYNVGDLPTLREEYLKEQNEDLEVFREFCRNRYQSKTKNFKMQKQIELFNKKIENLNKVKDELINLDESRSNVQTSDLLNIL